MKPSITKTILAGIIAGMVINVTMLLTFRVLGFGWNGHGILVNPELQSPKVIRVWTEIKPLPLVVDKPAPIIVGLVIFGIIHAFIYRMVASAWPQGVGRRGARMAIMVFLLVFVYWEFFTPFNQLGEPLPLIGLELVFWAAIATAEGFSIAAVMEKRRN